MRRNCCAWCAQADFGVRQTVDHCEALLEGSIGVEWVAQACFVLFI